MRHRYVGLVALLFAASFAANGNSTISEEDRFAYAANAGWIDCHADGTNGVVVGESYCSGYAYAANFGWIHFGGAPLQTDTPARTTRLRTTG